MNIWTVSMECAGINEAGGVKNVTYSLCNEFAKMNHMVTLFTPVFKCTDFSNVENLQKDFLTLSVQICNSTKSVTFSKGKIKNTAVNIIFVNHKCYSEKDEIYVYSSQEEAENPFHIRGTGHQDVNFLDTLFQKAVCEYGTHLTQEEKPDVIHCHDASTAMLPAYIYMNRSFYPETKSFITIHNAGPSYHHEYKTIDEAAYNTMLPYEILKNAFNDGKIEPFLAGAQFGKLTTVSEFYAEELTDPANSVQTQGLSRLFYEKHIPVTGITNGIDYDRYNPETPEYSQLPYSFSPLKLDLNGKNLCRKYFLEFCRKNISSPEKYLSHTKDLVKFGHIDSVQDKKIIMLAFHGRIVSQKGILVLTEAARKLFSEFPQLRFVIMGQGNKYEEENVIQFTRDFSGKAVYFYGYNRETARLCVAASDFLILPSQFEPCCLEDFIAQIYGTIPVAHKTGGLKKIIDGKTGFLFEPDTAEALSEKIKSVILNLFTENSDKINEMIKFSAEYIRDFYSWDKVAEKYINIFKNI